MSFAQRIVSNRTENNTPLLFCRDASVGLNIFPWHHYNRTIVHSPVHIVCPHFFVLQLLQPANLSIPTILGLVFSLTQLFLKQRVKFPLFPPPTISSTSVLSFEKTLFLLPGKCFLNMLSVFSPLLGKFS